MLTENLIKKVQKGCCYCSICNQPIYVNDYQEVEYIKSKNSGEKWYHDTCIENYLDKCKGE